MSVQLVLIGGWGVTSAVWAPLRAALGPHIATHTPSLPGHDSDIAPSSATLDGWVDAVCAQLPETAIICGSSLGAIIAMRLALRAPARAAKLILIGASPRPAHTHDWHDALDAGYLARLRNDFATAPEQTRRHFVMQQARGDALCASVEQALEDALVDITPAHRALVAEGLGIFSDTDLRAQIAALACPVRLLHGANDALVPVGVARWLAETIPEARLSIFDDAGHVPFISRPAHCATLIRAFIDI